MKTKLFPSRVSYQYSCGLLANVYLTIPIRYHEAFLTAVSTGKLDKRLKPLNKFLETVYTPLTVEYGNGYIKPESVTYPAMTTSNSVTGYEKTECFIVYFTAND